MKVSGLVHVENIIVYDNDTTGRYTSQLRCEPFYLPIRHSYIGCVNNVYTSRELEGDDYPLETDGGN